MSLRCVLLDFDGVLADYDKHVRVAHLAHAIGSTPALVQHAIYGSGIEDAADRGELDAQAYLDALSREAGAEVSLTHWIAARRAATQLRAGVMQAVERIATRTPVALLTNNGTLMAEHLGEIAPGLFPRFTGRSFASAQFGCSKPDPAVYAACLRRLGVTAAETLFVDDNAGNVGGARVAGLHVHHYQNFQAFLDALTAYDLL